MLNILKLLVFMSIFTSCFGGPYNEAPGSNDEETREDANTDSITGGSEANSDIQKTPCLIMGAYWDGEQCIQGIKKIYNHEDVHVAQRTDGAIVAWGRGAALDNYDRMRNILSSNTIPIAKVSFSEDKGISILLENGRLLSFGLMTSSNFDIIHSLDNVIEVVGTNNGTTALLDYQGIGNCDQGCEVVKIGENQPGAEIKDATNVYSSNDTALTIVLHTDKTISHFPARDPGVIESRWNDFDPALNSNVISVYIGYNETYAALKEDGTAFVWGNELYGGVLDELVGTLDNIRPVNGFYHGEYMMYAVKNDGTIAAWGDDEYYTTDDDDYTSLTAQMGELVNIRKLAWGYESTLALRNDGKIFFWGYNEYGKQILDKVGDRVVKDIMGNGYDYIVTLDDDSVVIGGYYSYFNTDQPILDVERVFANEEQIIYQKKDGSIGVMADNVNYVGAEELISASNSVKRFFTSRHSYTTFGITEDLQVIPVGAASHGGDMNLVSYEEADRIYSGNSQMLF